ncbi:flavin-containing monooxygenase [Peribacillus acanthi]|uniref:flavin-containing monooxygenase n=1 Tax=Peribacillus acanthi TaxID=2171554 RepID=UPI000D3E2E48|nr:NAD(P)/FAD-dependent oxidoreductase [Peribacillus acanthi]
MYDVVIIGGGQAGLSMGYHLKGSSLSYLILDNNKRIGDVWRNRYDSLVLFTPRSYSCLPGLPLEGDKSAFPTKNEIADYLELYVKTFELPIQLNTIVKRVSKEKNLFKIETHQSIIQAKTVVIATGAFQTPYIPSFSNQLSPNILQLHSSNYRSPSQLNEGAVLVVGGGNSGSQIAVELSKNHETFLSVGQKIRFLPMLVANRSIFWWFDKSGILNANRHSFIGGKIQNNPDPIFGYELKGKIQNREVKMKGRTADIKNDEIYFEDASSIRVKNIIWSTGFSSDFTWIDIKNLLDSKGRIIHDRGVTNIEGLYFLGLPWQHRRGSALLLGVGEDAEYLYDRILMNGS